MGGHRKRTPILILVIAAVIAAVLGYILLRGGDSGSDSATPAANKVGERIDLGGVQFSVVRSYESRGTDSERPQLRQTFTIARVSLANETDGPVTVKPGDFALFVDGLEMPRKTLNYVFDNLAEVALQPGAAREGAVSWENPVRFKIKTLVYTGPSGEKAAVDLLKSVE